MSATWPSYEHVNVQVGVDAWLAGRRHEVYSITGMGFMYQIEIVGIGDLLQASRDGPFGSAGVGGVMTTAIPSGPDGQTHACVSHGVYLVHDGDTRLALVLQPVTHGPEAEIVLQIAEQREVRPGEHPLLFQLLNDMDGLNSAADMTFLLTTNRADLLEPALAERPGRVDLAAELPVPDAGARRRLIRLYQGNLVLDLAREGHTSSSGPRG